MSSIPRSTCPASACNSLAAVAGRFAPGDRSASRSAAARAATRRGESLRASPVTIRRATRAGLARLGAGASVSITIEVNGAGQPQETARAIRAEIEDALGSIFGQYAEAMG